MRSGSPAGARSGHRVSSSRSSAAISMRGDVHAEAEMRATAAERHVRVGVATHIEAIGIDEHVGVTVARAVEHHDLVAGRDRLVADHRVFHRSATEVRDRRCAPQHLVDRRRQEGVEVGLQPGALIGVVEQQLYACGNEVPRRVATRVDEQQEEPVELRVREPISVDLGLDQLDAMSSLGFRAWPGSLGRRSSASRSWPPRAARAAPPRRHSCA